MRVLIRRETREWQGGRDGEGTGMFTYSCNGGDGVGETARVRGWMCEGGTKARVSETVRLSEGDRHVQRGSSEVCEKGGCVGGTAQGWARGEGVREGARRTGAYKNRASRMCSRAHENGHGASRLLGGEVLGVTASGVRPGVEHHARWDGR